MKDDFNSYPLTGWFPGHMFKATKNMAEALKLIDLVVELVDARAPLSTRNPELRRLLSAKPFLIVANKADLASPAVSKKWAAWCQAQGIRIHFLDSRRKTNVSSLLALWRQIVLDERSARGVTRPLLRPVRILIAGVPNVGKSTLVNHLCERTRAQIGPKPGVTRSNQWIPISGGIELLDTPGILWPRIREKKHELLLALLGIFKDELIPQELLASFLAWKLEECKYRIDWPAFGLAASPETEEELLGGIATRRGFLKPGGHPDFTRAAISFIKDFRDGRLGRISFENPPANSEVTDD